MDPAAAFELSPAELRAVTAYAVACAEPVLALFERDRPDDPRARDALEQARAFAEGGNRTNALRVVAFEAHRGAKTAAQAGLRAGAEAARAAGHAAGAAYLHPLPKATQGGHILLAAAHAAHALELDEAPERAAAYLATSATVATATVVAVLRRYPPAPSGRGRVGQLWRELDDSLRRTR